MKKAIAFTLAAARSLYGDCSQQGTQTSEAEAEKTAQNDALVEALEGSANPYTVTRFTYEEFKTKHGELIFGGLQPKRALDAVEERLNEDGYYMQTGVQVRSGGAKRYGFAIKKMNDVVAEQLSL